MTHSQAILKTPSPEFTALCQAQMTLLTQTLQADWGAIYLTESIADDTPTHLIPVVVYPQASPFAQKIEPIKELPAAESRHNTSETSSIADLEGQTTSLELNYLHSIGAETDNLNNNRLILPLIQNEQMMGLLITGRHKKQWNQQELVQIEKIANTLAIACLLDRKQQWYERQLQESHLRQTLEQERLDNFLHQLRNPLTALKTFGKLLLKRFASNEKDRTAIKGILRESDRLQDLIAEFEAEIAIATETPTVDLDNPNTPSLSERPAPFLLPGTASTVGSVAIEDILDPLLLSATAIAQERQITLTANYPSNIPHVKANARALREVLSNSIDNALKYTPTGGQVKITIESEPKQNQVGIFISDTGYGIPPEDREHLFKRHYRGAQARGNIPGTGLGLAIARELIEQMQGKIELISPNPENPTAELPGTVLKIWLPIWV